MAMDIFGKKKFVKVLCFVVFVFFANSAIAIKEIHPLEDQGGIMDYSVQTKDTIKIIGISLRTTNEKGQSSKDIPSFWQKFFQEDILSKIPSKKGMDIFCLYTDYEGDFMAPYTVILGCEVANFDHIPEGMVGKTIAKATYAVVHAGDSANVSSTWGQIWRTKLRRTYFTDFEVYKKSLPEASAVADIFVGIQ